MSTAARTSAGLAGGAGFPRSWLRRMGIDLQPGEGAVASALFVYFFLIVAFQYVSKSVRQSTFIDDLGADKLPIVYVVLALCSVPILLLYNRMVDRLARHHLIAGSLVVIVASVVGFWWLYQFPSTWVRVAFYVWVSIVYVLNVSQFWSYANHALDPRQAKRLFGFVGAGGLLGGVTGGLLASAATDLVDTRFALLVAAAILLTATGPIYLIHRLARTDEERRARAPVLSAPERARGGLELIRRSRHLQLIAALMFLTVVVANIVDIQFNWAMEQATVGLPKAARLDALTGGYGDFYAIMGVSALLFQLIFTSGIHRKLGIGVAMRVLPVTMALGTGGLFLAASMLPGAMLMACRLLKIGENGLRYSLDQTTRELLFLPVPSKARLKAKAYIDVFVQRAGKAAGGLLLLPVTFGLVSAVEMGWASLALIVTWLVVIAGLHREYVHSFRQGLKQETVGDLAPFTLNDMTTLELLVQSLGSVEPRQVLHSLELLDTHGRGHLVPPLLLYHQDTRVRLKTLGILRSSGRTDAVPLIEGQLGAPEASVRAEAIRALADLKDQDAGLLMLPRLQERDPGVRSAAVTFLINHGDQEKVTLATATLTGMLSDADFRCRAEAAKAIGALRSKRSAESLIGLLRDPHPQVAQEAIAAVRKRALRGGFNPLYPPILISLLQNRRLKHESREALVAFGEEVLPQLVHFMTDPGETSWVRRALPKTIAGIGTPAAVKSLVDSLGSATDSFLRRKVVEALAPLRGQTKAYAREITEAIRFETARYLGSLRALRALGIEGKGRVEGPLVHWDSREEEPGLLDRLLAERMEDHLSNLFGLLALLHPQRDMGSAHRSLVAGPASMRAGALEYLDNTLRGAVRRHVLAAVGDAPLAHRLRGADRSAGARQRSKPEMLGDILGADEEFADLVVAAIYMVYTDRVRELYPRVESLVSGSHDPFVRETAAWAKLRWSVT